MSFSLSGSVITQANESGISITAAASITGGVRFTCTQGYAAGNLVKITGTTNYNGEWIVDAATGTTFDVKVSVTGGSITYVSSQSGTAARGDANLSGLSAISGVTTTDFGFYTKYRLGASQSLVINGVVAYNRGSSQPYEQIALAPSGYSFHSIRINGSLTIGTDRDPALQKFAHGVPSILQEQVPVGSESLGATNDGAGTSPKLAIIYCAADGALRVYGQAITFGASIGISATAAAYIIKDAAITAPTMYDFKGGSYDGFSYTGVHPTLVSALLLVAPPALLRGYVARGGGAYVGGSGAMPTATFTVSGVPSLPASVTLFVGGRSDSFANAPTINFVNLALGSNYTLTPPPDNRYVKLNLLRRCVLTVKDQNETAISGALVRVSGKSGSTVYTATTDAGGSSGNIDVLVAYFTFNGAGVATKTYYSIANDITDNFRFRVYDYASLIGNLPDQVLKGEADLALPWTLFTDTNVTLSKSAASALTSISTLNDLYDAAKWWKVQSANTTYPTAETQLISANGDTLLLGTLNLVVDGTVAAAFAVNTGTGTITVKSTALAAGSKFGYIKSTSGTITMANAAAMSCGVDLDGAVLVAQDIDAVTGAISTTGTCRIDVAAPGVYPAAAINAASKIRVTAATSGDVHDCRACTFTSGAVFENNSGQPITLKLSPSATVPTLTETSGTITLDNAVSIVWSMPNVIDDSNVLLWNQTADAEIEGVAVSGGVGYSKTLTSGVHYTIGDTIVALVGYSQAGVYKQVLRAAATAGTSNIIISDAQVDWAEPNTHAIDGSTIAECATDYVEVEVEVDDDDNSTTKLRIALFMTDALMTLDGLRNWVSLGGVPALRWLSAAHAVVDADVAGVTVINVKAASKLSVIDSFAFEWSDGVTHADAVLGSSIVWKASTEALLVAVGSAVLPSDITAIAAEVERTGGMLIGVRDLVEADEIHTGTTVEKRLKGTGTPLLTKNHSGTPLSTFQAVQP